MFTWKRGAIANQFVLWTVSLCPNRQKRIWQNELKLPLQQYWRRNKGKHC